MLHCNDIQGPCCKKCHDEFEHGYGSLITVGNGKAEVCCDKAEAAHKLIENKGESIAKGESTEAGTSKEGDDR